MKYPLYTVQGETTIVLNIATLKVFPLADSKARSLFDCSCLIHVSGKVSFHLLLAASSLTSSPNSNTYSARRFHVRLLQRPLAWIRQACAEFTLKKCWQQRGSIACLAGICGNDELRWRIWKVHRWYLHRSTQEGIWMCAYNTLCCVYDHCPYLTHLSLPDQFTSQPRCVTH